MISLLTGIAGLLLLVACLALYDPRLGIGAAGVALTFIAYVNADGGPAGGPQ